MKVPRNIQFGVLLLCSLVPCGRAQLRPDDDPDRVAAQAAMREHRYADAIHLIAKELKVTPGDLSLKTELGKAYLYDRKDDRAIKIFRDVLKDDPSHRVAKLELARALGYHRKFDESNNLYRELLDAKPDEAAEIGLVRNLIHQGRRAEASREIDVALSEFPNSVRLREYQRMLATGEIGNGRSTRVGARPQEPAGSEKRAELIGYASFLSDSAGSRAIRATERLNHTLTPTLSNQVGLEEWALWQTSMPRANLLLFRDSLRFHPIRAFSLTGGGGSVRFADTKTRALYSGDLTVFPLRGLLLSAGFARMPIAPTLTATQYDLTSIQWDGHIDVNRSGWRGYAYGIKQHYSDTNHGNRAGAELVRWIGPPSFAFGLGYQFRYISFDQSLQHGYFEPSDYRSHLGVAGIKYRIGSAFRAEYTGRAGGETVAGTPFESAWDISFRHRVLLRHWNFGAEYSYFHLAQDTGPYNSQLGRFLIAYRF